MSRSVRLFHIYAFMVWKVRASYRNVTPAVQTWRLSDNPASYLGVAGFKSWPGNRLSLIDVYHYSA